MLPTKQHLLFYKEDSNMKQTTQPSRSPAEKSESLLDLLATGLQKHAHTIAGKTLGDRSTYIGMSDIGQALECPRAALMRKIFPPYDNNLQKQLVLQRGHWLEHGIEQALFASNLNFFPQLEITTLHQNVPVKAHPDFVLVWEKPHPAVRILELKSTENLPTTLYSSYEIQLYGQIGLLKSLWNQKAFAGNTTFPELCKKKFGISLPTDPEKVDMEAWIVCVSMSDARTFGPYTSDSSMLGICLSTAAALWGNIQQYRNNILDLGQVAYTHDLHPLCSFCDFTADCPKFAGEYHPEWEDVLEKLAQLKKRRSQVEQEITEIEDMLKTTCSSVTGWINTDSYRFRTTQQSKRILDKNLLRQHLVNSTDADPDTVLSRCETRGASFSRLYVNKIN
jgi:hypothetical protein